MSITPQSGGVEPKMAPRSQDQRPGTARPAVVASQRRPGDPVELRPDLDYPTVLDRSEQRGAEAFGILRSRLLSMHATLGARSVLITSAEIEEGKTLIALNLAISFGQLGQKRVLLVDGDLRRRGISHLLRLEHSMGLNEFLQQGKPFAQVVQRTTFSELSVVPAGNPPAGSLPRVLEGPRWAEFLEQAREQFELIIIDSLPAAAPFADFELLLAPCETALLVVRMRKTTREGIARAMQRIDRKKLLGVLVNDTKSSGYYSYSRYYREGTSK